MCRHAAATLPANPIDRPDRTAHAFRIRYQIASRRAGSRACVVVVVIDRRTPRHRGAGDVSLPIGGGGARGPDAAGHAAGESELDGVLMEQGGGPGRVQKETFARVRGLPGNGAIGSRRPPHLKRPETFGLDY